MGMATFRAQVARVLVMNLYTQEPIGTLFDDHTIAPEEMRAQAPPPPAQPQKPGNQWAAGDHMHEIRVAVFVSLASDACGWPLTAEQSANLSSFLQRMAQGKFSEREQYNQSRSIIRNDILRAGRQNFCANPAQQRDFKKQSGEIAPLGPFAAPLKP